MNLSSPEGFAAEFAESMREFAEHFFQQLAPACPPGNDNWRAEACAALWAATQAVFDSSVLSPHERKELTRELTRNLVPFWQKQSAGPRDVSQLLACQPVPRGHYGHSIAPGNLAAAADSIVIELLRSAGVSLVPPSITERTLATALAHRMFADLRRLDEYKKRRERRRPARLSAARA